MKLSFTRPHNLAIRVQGSPFCKVDELVYIKGKEYYLSLSDNLTMDKSEAKMVHPDVADYMIDVLNDEWPHLRFKKEPVNGISYEMSKKRIEEVVG